jgi:hypothetical protein
LRWKSRLSSPNSRSLVRRSLSAMVTAFLSIFLHALQLLGDALQFLVALLEILFDLLLGARRLRRIVEDSSGY